MSKATKRYSVPVDMTPLQAIESERALHRQALLTGDGRLFAAATRIRTGLYEAGWDLDSSGTVWSKREGR